MHPGVLLAEELSFANRVAADNQHFAAIMPYASHLPFEVWILPKAHQSSFGWVPSDRLQPLFELGSGMSINTVLPEEAVEFLAAVDTGSGNADPSA